MPTTACTSVKWNIRHAEVPVITQNWFHLEELAHGLVVKAVAAVEDDTLDGQGLGEVLGGLCLAGTSWAGRGAPQVHVDCSYQGTVTPASHDPVGHMPSTVMGSVEQDACM